MLVWHIKNEFRQILRIKKGLMCYLNTYNEPHANCLVENIFCLQYIENMIDDNAATKIKVKLQVNCLVKCYSYVLKLKLACILIKLWSIT